MMAKGIFPFLTHNQEFNGSNFSAKGVILNTVCIVTVMPYETTKLLILNFCTKCKLNDHQLFRIK